MSNKIITLDGLNTFLLNVKTYLTELLLSKQDKLISGANIKTVNGKSILGSGDITIESNSKDDGDGTKFLSDDGTYKYVNKEVKTITDDIVILLPNIYYKKTNTSDTLDITLGNNINNILNEYFIEFTTSQSGTAVTLPNNIKWVNGEIPSFENNSTYQLSIIENLGVYVKFC